MLVITIDAVGLKKMGFASVCRRTMADGSFDKRGSPKSDRHELDNKTPEWAVSSSTFSFRKVAIMSTFAVCRAELILMSLIALIGPELAKLLPSAIWLVDWGHLCRKDEFWASCQSRIHEQQGLSVCSQPSSPRKFTSVATEHSVSRADAYFWGE